jgi:tetratricopeptide (TPR) repeat protein
LCLRFFTLIKLFPGITINMSKSGPSLSFGPRGLKHTIGPRGSRSTVGLPGSGLHYSVQHGKSRRKKVEQSSSVSPALEALPPESYRIDPATASAKRDRDFLRAVVAYQSGQPVAALELLSEIETSADAYWLAGVIELRDENWLSAAEHFEDALKDEGSLGELCARNNVAIEIAYSITPEVTAHIGPDPRSTRLALAEAYQGAGELSAALQILKSMIKTHSSDLIIALSLAEISFEADDGRKMKMADLVKILEETDAVEGLNWARDFNRARALTRIDGFKEAIDAYTSAMSDDDIPDDMLKLAWYEKALTFIEAGDRTRGRQELSSLYAYDKTFADVEQRLRSRG